MVNKHSLFGYTFAIFHTLTFNGKLYTSTKNYYQNFNGTPEDCGNDIYVWT